MQASDEDFVEKRIKVVLVGDSGVGKTSIATKLCKDEFTRQYTPTPGIDFCKNNLAVGRYRNVSLHIWDVAGLALHSKMLDKYIYDAKLILLVYDVTNSSSFDILQEWISTINGINENTEENNPLMAIIGNKCDMDHQRTVKRDKSHKFAADKGLIHYDMSARTGESVALSIVNLAAKVLGIQLTRTDQDFHKPIIMAEIGDTVDLPIHNVSKRLPNKKSHQINSYPTLPLSKSAVCSLQ